MLVLLAASLAGATHAAASAVPSAGAGPPAVAAPAGGDDEIPGVDPYTRGDPDALAEAGYVSFGPFAFGDGATTDDVQDAVGTTRVLWVETAHFRIGSTLEEYRVGPGERERLRDELVALARRVPRVKPTTRTLDPWLRLHLLAARLEALYAELCARLGVTDASFPSGPGALVDGRYMGEGPYLGQAGKYLVLHCERSSDLGRYQRAHVGFAEDLPKRYTFRASGSLYFGTAVELSDGPWREDLPQHCMLVANVTHNLVAGFKSYVHALPVWFEEGIAHWTSRRVDPHWSTFPAGLAGRHPGLDEWDWEPKLRGRVRFDAYPDYAAMSAWRTPDGLSAVDHMFAWSRVDHLMSREGDGLAVFLGIYKAPLDPHRPVEEARAEAERNALRAAWDLDGPAFDAAWHAWVLDEYRKR